MTQAACRNKERIMEGSSPAVNDLNGNDKTKVKWQHIGKINWERGGTINLVDPYGDRTVSTESLSLVGDNDKLISRSAVE